MPQSISDYLKIFRRYRSYAREDRRYIALAVVAMIGIAMTNTVMIWLIGTPFDYLQAGKFDALWQALWLFAGVVTINLLMHFSSMALADYVGLRYIGRLRNHLFQHMLQRSIPHMNRYSRGDLLARLTNDMDRIQDLILQLPLNLVSHCLTLLFYSAMLVWINWKLALLALAITPLFIFHQHIFGPLKRKFGERFFKANGTLLGFEENGLDNLQGVSSFGVEKRMAHSHAEHYALAAHWRMKSVWTEAGFHVSFSLLVYLTGIVIIFAGIYAVQADSISTGQLVSFLLYLGYLSFPVREIARLNFQAQEDLAATDRVSEILDDVDPTDTSRKVLNVSAGTIEFKDLVFGYSGGPILFDHINLTVAGGETVALVGPSGSGKSTLAKLLMGFYQAQSGSISIDDQDISDVDRASLRRAIAVVWQEPFLLQDSVRANLLLANANADDKQLIEACKAGGAWQFIETLEQGLDTPLGPDGTELSIGQQQRLSISRAFLADAPLLLLDEPTSALDSHSEQALVNSLERLRQNHTTLIIAHRFSSIRTAQRVAYFDGNGAVTIGSHDELLRTCNGYRQAVEWQLSENEKGD